VDVYSIACSNFQLALVVIGQPYQKMGRLIIVGILVFTIPVNCTNRNLRMPWKARVFVTKPLPYCEICGLYYKDFTIVMTVWPVLLNYEG